MSQSLLLCYGIIKDQLGKENRVYSGDNPFTYRELPRFIRQEYLGEVLTVLEQTGNAQICDQLGLHPLARQLLFELTSSIFLRLLEAATGFDNLLPDPYLTEGGFSGETRPEAQQHFPCDKLQKVLRLDVLLSTSSPFEADNVTRNPAPGSCLLQSCTNGTLPVIPDGRTLILYYYLNPQETSPHE